MRHLFTVAGMLRWSSWLDYYLEADGGGYWLLDVPGCKAEDVDALVHSRVAVRGVRSGFAELYLMRVEARQE